MANLRMIRTRGGPYARCVIWAFSHGLKVVGTVVVCVHGRGGEVVIMGHSRAGDVVHKRHTYEVCLITI